MTKIEITERIEQLERWCWFEQMADFMNWNKYNAWQREIYELKNQLKEMD